MDVMHVLLLLALFVFVVVLGFYVYDVEVRRPRKAEEQRMRDDLSRVLQNVMNAGEHSFPGEDNAFEKSWAELKREQPRIERLRHLPFKVVISRSDTQEELVISYGEDEHRIVYALQEVHKSFLLFDCVTRGGGRNRRVKVSGYQNGRELFSVEQSN